MFATVSSQLIKDLRHITGSPLKDCMKALEETQGDINKAKEILRKKGLVDAEKKLTRETVEGLIGIKHDKSQNLFTMIEMHCETDFVARTDQFQNGVENILNTIHQQQSLEVNSIQAKNTQFINNLCKEIKLARPFETEYPNQTIEEGLKYLISKTQENCKLAKVYKSSWNPQLGQVLQSYIHNTAQNKPFLGKIGVAVKLQCEQQSDQLEQIAQQLSMHIAAMKPKYQRKEEVPKEIKEKAMEEGKEKTLRKLYVQEVLLEQDFAMSDESISIKQYLKDKEKEIGKPIQIKEWTLFTIG